MPQVRASVDRNTELDRTDMETLCTTENPLKFLDFINKLVSDPNIGPLIDVTRMVRLPRYEAALKAAVEHYKLHGDSTLIKRLASPLEQSKYHKPVLLYACDQASLTFSIHEGEIKFEKKQLSETRSAPKRSLGEYIDSSYKAVPEVTSQLSKQVKRTSASGDHKQKHKKKKRDIDMLDSWARLPGSFEGGKRR
jgi:hypothetical protein